MHHEEGEKPDEAHGAAVSMHHEEGEEPDGANGMPDTDDADTDNEGEGDDAGAAGAVIKDTDAHCAALSDKAVGALVEVAGAQSRAGHTSASDKAAAPAPVP